MPLQTSYVGYHDAYAQEHEDTAAKRAFGMGHLVTSFAVGAALAAATVGLAPRPATQNMRATGLNVAMGEWHTSLTQATTSFKMGAIDLTAAGKPPHKFAVSGATPVSLQLGRGTCWVFAAVDVLEWSYRSQGVAYGWLQPHEYVQMSEQAFGIAVLDACLGMDKNVSCVIGDEVWRGRQLMPTSTEGGDQNLLFYLKSLESTAALPHSVCPYTPTAGHDHDCPGLYDAIRRNPLEFSMASINWM